MVDHANGALTRIYRDGFHVFSWGVAPSIQLLFRFEDGAWWVEARLISTLESGNMRRSPTGREMKTGSLPLGAPASLPARGGGVNTNTPAKMPALVRLRRREDRAVEVRSCAVKSRAVSNRNCVAARRGGEHRNENDQSVTQAVRKTVAVNSIRSAWTGEPSSDWRSL